MGEAGKDKRKLGESQSPFRGWIFAEDFVPEKPRAAFISGQLRVVGQVLNISLGGLLLFTKQPIATGTKGDLSVVLPNGRFYANAIVRHDDPRGRSNLEFTKMSPEDRDALWAFCGTLRGTEVRKATPTEW